MRFLTSAEVLELHRLVIQQSGGAKGVRDLGALESALAQVSMTFGAEELYPTLVHKAAALGFSIISDHPFVDGNKRVGHAAMETFLILNGWEITASLEAQERIVLAVASGKLKRAGLTEWLRNHVKECSS